MTEEELEKYLESWDRHEDLLGFSFFERYGTDDTLLHRGSCYEFKLLSDFVRSLKIQVAKATNRQKNESPEDSSTDDVICV